jgi:hypothetical protein
VQPILALRLLLHPVGQAAVDFIQPFRPDLTDKT